MKQYSHFVLSCCGFAIRNNKQLSMDIRYRVTPAILDIFQMWLYFFIFDNKTINAATEIIESPIKNVFLPDPLPTFVPFKM